MRNRRVAYRSARAACGVLCLAAASFAVSAEEYSSPHDTPPQQKAAAPAVTVIEARRLTFIDNILVTGSLVPREEILVGPEVDGYRIVEVLAEEGDEVKAGQVLAKLSRDTLEAQLAQNSASEAKAKAAIDQVQSQIAESEATLRQAEDSFNRVKPLRETGIASQATFDEREMGFRTSKARMAAQRQGSVLTQADLSLIQAQRRELQVKLDHTDIKAPAGGIISRRTARIGALSSSGAEALFRIIARGEIELDAEVPEFYMPRLRAGQRAQVEALGSAERQGEVRLVSTEINTSSRLGRVRLFLGKSGDLRIGSFAKGMIDAGQRDGVGVPSTAVLYQNETAAVLAVQDNKVKERPVKTGLLTGDNVEIKEGLRAGEVVVLRAGSLLRSGDAISPQFAEKVTAAQTSARESQK